MSKKYRLKKDISTFDVQAKAGCIGYEMIDPLDRGSHLDPKVWFDGGRFYYMQSTIKKWPEWFEEVTDTERIEVRIIPNEYYAEDKWYGWYVLETPKAIPRDKLSAIKEAIEKVINQQPTEERIEPKYIVNGEKLYTQSDLDKARENAFNAGRMAVHTGVNTSKDYLNSINK